jgi:hypothetical protein
MLPAPEAGYFVELMLLYISELLHFPLQRISLQLPSSYVHMDVGSYNHMTNFTSYKSFGVADVGNRGCRKIQL